MMTSFCTPLAENGIFYAFTNSDFLGQLICVVLLVWSIVTWVLMLNKGSGLSKAERDSRSFLVKFRQKKNPLALAESTNEEYSPISAIYFAACKKIEAFHLTDPMSGMRRALSDAELDVLENTMDQEKEEQMALMEKQMVMLQISVSSSPLLGLFGTVWGITIAFTELAIKGKADIQTLAPGVSGALLTTVLALIVAIPSQIGYNLILAKLRRIEVMLDEFEEEFSSRLKIEQLDSYSAMQKTENR